MRTTKTLLAPAMLGAAALIISGCASEPGGDATEATGAPVPVEIIYSETGALAAYGAAYKAGFEAGLDYVTDGTGVVAGHEVEVHWADDAGDADKAVSLFKEAVGDGTQIVAGTVASGIAVQLAEQAAQNQVLYISGPAATDAVTGVNEYTFRSGRQTIQDVKTAGTFLEDLDGKQIVVFAQDTAFGQGNLAAVEAVLGAGGASVEGVLVPESATEFTPFAQQLLASGADLVFVAWAGATSGAMWQALSQQGVFETIPVVTGLGDTATYGAYGEASEQISFLNHYFPGAGGNDVEAAMLERIEAAGETADLFSPDGFNAAIMIARAIETGAAGGEFVVADAIAGLEGWSFEGPKGETTIRAEDHALIQPMFQVRLVADGSSFVPELVDTVAGDAVAP